MRIGIIKTNRAYEYIRDEKKPVDYFDGLVKKNISDPTKTIKERLEHPIIKQLEFLESEFVTAKDCMAEFFKGELELKSISKHMNNNGKGMDMNKVLEENKSMSKMQYFAGGLMWGVLGAGVGTVAGLWIGIIASMFSNSYQEGEKKIVKSLTISAVLGGIIGFLLPVTYGAIKVKLYDNMMLRWAGFKSKLIQPELGSAVSIDSYDPFNASTGFEKNISKA